MSDKVTLSSLSRKALEDLAECLELTNCELEKQNKLMRECIEFYADMEGNLARQTLEQLKE